MTEQELWKLYQQVPETKPVFYRLYHDEQGQPLFYSMEDVPGTYIEITQEDYSRGLSNVRVRNGRLVEITWTTSQKLVPGSTGTACCAGDVSIVTAGSDCVYWSKRIYETN